MDQEKQHDIALMRYSVISPVISGLPETYSSLEAFYRDASKKGTIAPDGTLKHFAPATIERWYRNYRRGGFDALIPQYYIIQRMTGILLQPDRGQLHIQHHLTSHST